MSEPVKIERKTDNSCFMLRDINFYLAILEVEAGIKPLDIRREELSVRQAVRIMMKADEDHIKVSWHNFQERDGTEHRISPFGKMNVQVADMMSDTGITLNSLEKDCNY